MRLSILIKGHNFLQKLQFKIIKTIMGTVPGPIATLSYRRSFFGKHYAKWLHSSMRGLNYWSIGEAELIATYVSKNNKCQYCYGDHVAVAKNVFEEELIYAVMDNIDEALINDKMKTILKFIKKLTTTPYEISEKDILELRKAEISNEAIKEAINICGVFCVINRLADAFDFETSSNTNKTGNFLFKYGYSLASVKG